MKKILILFILWATPSMAMERIECEEDSIEIARSKDWEFVCCKNISDINLGENEISCKFKEVTNER